MTNYASRVVVAAFVLNAVFTALTANSCEPVPRVGEVTKKVNDRDFMVRQEDGTDELRRAQPRNSCDVGDLFATCSRI